MKLGLVGPSGLVEKMNRVIKLAFPDIEPVNCSYKVYTEAPNIVKYQQPYLDTVLFAGPTPYFSVKAIVKPLIPWEYIPRNSSSLLRVLLEAALTGNDKISNLSFDSYQEDALYEAYEEIGLDKNHLDIRVADLNLPSSGYLDYVCAFHERHFSQREVSCCITALESVYEKLTQKKIPCLMIKPTTDVIRETVHKLVLSHQIQVSQQSQIVALSIHIDDPNEHSIYSDNEYQYAIDRMQISKQIYLFAQSIQAAIVETGLKDFLLFSTRKMLEDETNNLENIELLRLVKENAANTVSLGIGFGNTAQEAKHGAGLGMLKASKLGVDMAFIVYNNKKITGPIKGDPCETDDAIQKIDEKFLRIAEQAGVSINTIFKLYSIMEQYEQTTFTSMELAELLGVTLRTINRILGKLESCGACAIVGKKIMANSGRPRRIIKLNI
ncbi:MAG: HTH domain-containing protein [Negativicutes bacterium]|nr:HTH domain-containing protein [Negativicutes bacterium]